MSELLDRVQAASKRLDVYVHDRLVGHLERKDVVGSVFTYLPSARQEDFVSLLMPVRMESYSSNRGLLPIFQQNLPEGFMRREMTERFGRVLATDDHMLLAFTGGDTIGRVRVVPGAFTLDWAAPIHADIDRILHAASTGKVFEQLMAEYQGHGGVSGVFPKALVPRQCPQRATLHDDGYILKFSGPDTPSLSVNEFFSMRAAKRAGFEVPAFELSDDGEIFAIRRFDLPDNATVASSPSAATHGFEDFCALLALPVEQKYQGTMERVFKAIDAFTRGGARVKAKDTMVQAQLFAYASGNADLHVKNIGLVYDGIGDAHIAPTFDVVTTSAYERYKNQQPALSVAGKRVAALDKTFLRLAQERSGLGSAKLREIARRQAAALHQTSGDLLAYARAHPQHAPTCRAMARQWAAGVAMLEAFAPSETNGSRETAAAKEPTSTVRDDERVASAPAPRC